MHAHRQRRPGERRAGWGRFEREPGRQWHKQQTPDGRIIRVIKTDTRQISTQTRLRRLDILRCGVGRRKKKKADMHEHAHRGHGGTGERRGTHDSLSDTRLWHYGVGSLADYAATSLMQTDRGGRWGERRRGYSACRRWSTHIHNTMVVYNFEKPVKEMTLLVDWFLWIK